MAQPAAAAAAATIPARESLQELLRVNQPDLEQPEDSSTSPMPDKDSKLKQQPAGTNLDKVQISRTVFFYKSIKCICNEQYYVSVIKSEKKR